MAGSLGGYEFVLKISLKWYRMYIQTVNLCTCKNIAQLYNKRSVKWSNYIICAIYIYAYITLYYIIIYIYYIYIYSIQVFAFDYLCFNFAYVQFIQVWRLGHQRFEAVTARASSLCPRLHSSRGHPTLSWRAATNHLPVIRSIFMCFDCQSLTYEEQSQQASAGMGRASIGKRAQGWQFSAQFNLASVCHIQGI